MARIRTIKPDFFRHEGLQDLAAEHGAEVMLVFAALWGHCDKAGRFEWRPRMLKLDILPFLKFEMKDVLALLKDAGYVRHYVVDGKEYGVIDSFVEHQRIGGKEAQEPAKHPEPPIEEMGEQWGSNGEAQGIAGREGNRKGRGKEEEPLRESADIATSSLPKSFLDSPFREEAERFADWFAESLKPSTIKGSKAEREQWALVWYHLRSTDKRDNAAEMAQAIAWARGDPFWSKNFLSPTKLRMRDKQGQMFIDRFIAEHHQHKTGGRNGHKRGITPDQLKGIFDWIDSNPAIPA